MIIVRIEGGLGNQLFQYALGKNLALINNTELKLDLNYFKKSSFRTFELNHFNINEKEIIAQNIKYLKWANSKNKLLNSLYNFFFTEPEIYKEKHFHFDNEVFKCKNESYLSGFWQSEKYFISIKKQIQETLTFNPSFNHKFNNQIQQINNSESVALHVRRGDYLKNKNHLLLNLQYYEKALDLLTEKLTNPEIFIFSDDIEWCKLNLDVKLPHQFMSRNESHEDLKLMALCKHFIIANSTFSWWGAYLSKNLSKIVICPKNWFPEYSTNNSEDLFVEDWILI
ncbi:alpha-1,2-fucosyltransferase [Pedobacter alpinus]|uniref:Alpha-1,2-fucosyltransferase n=1 Tax=Pedobacter alpinus TaxID=1590643 RepID=A0ABW5TXB0_9SPHI